MSQLVARPAGITLGGVICGPDGTIKTPLKLSAYVPKAQLRRRFIPIPCELQHEILSRNAMGDAVVDLLDLGSANAEGRIKIFTTGGITLLATLLMANPAFDDTVSGIAPGLGLPWTDASAVGSGLASDFTMIDRDENVIMTGDVDIAGEEMNFPQVEVTVNDLVKILSCSYTAAA